MTSQHAIHLKLSLLLCRTDLVRSEDKLTNSRNQLTDTQAELQVAEYINYNYLQILCRENLEYFFFILQRVPDTNLACKISRA